MKDKHLGKCNFKKSSNITSGLNPQLPEFPYNYLLNNWENHKFVHVNLHRGAN